MHKIWIGGLPECVPYIAELFPVEPWLFPVQGRREAEHRERERAPELLSLSCLLRPDPSLLNPFSSLFLSRRAYCAYLQSDSKRRTDPNPNICNIPITMSGLDAPEVSAAYDAVRSDKDETNWLLISYASAVGNKLSLTKTGTGGLAEMVKELDDGQVQYGYVRVEYANDKESKRVKFALVVWIGENTKVMRKARVSIESGDVKRVLSHHSIAVTTGDRSELDEGDIVVRLRKAGGADYNGGRG